jgi:hypothetical protein
MQDVEETRRQMRPRPFLDAFDHRLTVGDVALLGDVAGRVKPDRAAREGCAWWQ